MTKTEIIEALITANLFVRFGKAMSPAELAKAAQALREVRGMSGKDRIEIHETIVATTWPASK